MIVTRKKSYGVRVHRGGGRYQWVGSFAFDDHDGKRGALKAAKEAESAALKKGARKKGTTTIGAYVDLVIEDYAQTKKFSTYDTARIYLTAFKNEFGERPLDDDAVEPDEAAQWAAEHRAGAKIMVTFYNRAIAERRLAYNPFKGLSRKTRGRKDKIPLKQPEVDRLAELAVTLLGAAYGPVFAALIKFAGYTGVRPGELFVLEWGDIDFERMRIHVARNVYKGRVALPKNNRDLEVKLTPQARDVLLGLPRTSSLIFTAKAGGRLSQPLLSMYWSPIAEAFGYRADKNGKLAKVAFYELRHRCAYWLYVECSQPDRIVAAQLRHTDGGKLIRELYGHGDHGALEELDRFFERGTNVVPLREARAS